jgi:hypothetical protein
LTESEKNPVISLSVEQKTIYLPNCCCCSNALYDEEAITASPDDRKLEEINNIPIKYPQAALDF